eukprot:361420-Chlamydomonas_euryale.AAC.4
MEKTAGACPLWEGIVYKHRHVACSPQTMSGPVDNLHMQMQLPSFILSHRHSVEPTHGHVLQPCIQLTMRGLPVAEGHMQRRSLCGSAQTAVRFSPSCCVQHRHVPRGSAPCNSRL